MSPVNFLIKPLVSLKKILVKLAQVTINAKIVIFVGMNQQLTRKTILKSVWKLILKIPVPRSAGLPNILLLPLPVLIWVLMIMKEMVCIVRVVWHTTQPATKPHAHTLPRSSKMVTYCRGRPTSAILVIH